MKNKKINKFIGGVLLCGSFLISSCGGVGQQEGDPNTIYFWHTFGQDIESSVIDLCEDFEILYEEEYGTDINIELDYQGSYDDILDKVNKSFKAGNTPTIAVAYPDHVADYLALESGSNQYVYNLEEFFDDPDIGFGASEVFNPSLKGVEDFVPSFLEEGQNYTKEGTYSLPFMKSSEVLLYNVPLLENVMSQYDPSVTDVNEFMNNITWDEFIELLRFISKDLNKFGNQLISPFIYDSDANLFISQCYQQGIPFVSMDENGKGSIDFNNDKAKAMVSELKGYYDEGLFITKGTNEGKYGSDCFIKNECIFTVGSTGGAGYNDPGTIGNFEVGISKVPSNAIDKDHEKYVSQGVTLTILKNNKFSDEVNDSRARIAWQLMTYLTSELNNISVCLSSNGYAPVRESCYTNEVYAEYLEGEDFMPRCANVVANEINGNYFNYPVFKGTAAAREQVGGLITQVFLGNETIDQAFDKAENQTKLEM